MLLLELEHRFVFLPDENQRLRVVEARSPDLETVNLATNLDDDARDEFASLFEA